MVGLQYGGGQFRLNPATGKKFTHGEVDEKGRIFVKYDSYVMGDGTFAEEWCSTYEIYKRERIRMVEGACKRRAKEKGVRFDLPKGYLFEIFPDDELCPVLGIKMDFAKGINRFNSPSVDRIVPGSGYVVGNVIWMSLRANVIKQDANYEEVRKVADWLESIQKEKK